MIPIGLIYYELLLLQLAYLAVILVWTIWSLRLAFRRNVKWQLRTWRGPLFILLTGLAFYCIWSIYDFRRHWNAYQLEQTRNFHPTLIEAKRLGSINMPIGTKLNLAIARQEEAFTQAAFPHAVKVNGVEALVAKRYLAIHINASYQTTGFTPENLRLTGIGTSQQAGWLCDASKEIVFDTHADGGVKSFRSCQAAEGNLIEGQPLPKASEIIVSEGRLYLDGRQGLDRWIVHLPKEGSYQTKDMTQTGGTLLLDADRKVIEQIEK